MRRRTTEPAGRDSFHVLDPAGAELAQTGSGPKIGLKLAQSRAERAYTNPIILTVERRSLFGPSTPLYRVVRDEHGTVHSFTLALED